MAARLVFPGVVPRVLPRAGWLPLTVLAFASVTGATVLTWAIRLFAADTLFIFFVAAVAVTSWAGGRRTGLLATVLSALVVDTIFIPPVGGLLPLHLADGVRLACFVAVATLIAILSGALHQARDRTERLREEADVWSWS